MKYIDSLSSGTLIKRYKRFFVDILFKSKIVTAHCPNSGSMMNLLGKNKVWFSKSNNPKRKLKYTLEIVKAGENLVGVNTHLTNKIVYEALKRKKIHELSKFTNIRTEVKFSDHTRFDFLLSNSKTKCFVEVKNVTLVRNKGIAEFPDAVTQRGKKHLEELINAKKRGFESCILYVLQRNDCQKFKIADDIDEDYKNAFNLAKKEGVKILCYDCKIDSKEVILNKRIKII